jgi:hypothetical protein
VILYFPKVMCLTLTCIYIYCTVIGFLYYTFLCKIKTVKVIAITVTGKIVFVIVFVLTAAVD